jgi:hypothetical protein
MRPSGFGGAQFRSLLWRSTASDYKQTMEAIVAPHDFHDVEHQVTKMMGLFRVLPASGWCQKLLDQLSFAPI